MNCDLAPQSILHTSSDAVAGQQVETNGIKPEPIDLSKWEPRPSDVVSFELTEEVTGRIFLIPTGGRLYVLDFIDKMKRRVFEPGFHVYITGFFGRARRDRIFSLGSDPSEEQWLPEPIGVFIVNPAGTVEITPQELPDTVLKTIAFACSRGVYRPIVV